MSDLTLTQTEPVGVVGAINTALLATLGVLSLVFNLDPQVSGAIALALGGWISVASYFVRSRVTPVAALQVYADAVARLPKTP